MTIADGVYGLMLEGVFDGTQAINLDNGGDTLGMTLHTDGYTPDFDTHVTYGQLTAELSGQTGVAGYTAGGAAVAATRSVDISTGVWTFDTSGDTQWTSATMSNVEGRVIYSSTASSRLVVCTDFDTPYSVTSGTLTIQENASGIWTIDYTP